MLSFYWGRCWVKDVFAGSVQMQVEPDRLFAL
jgi:hypothetical protein